MVYQGLLLGQCSRSLKISSRIRLSYICTASMHHNTCICICHDIMILLRLCIRYVLGVFIHSCSFCRWSQQLSLYHMTNVSVLYIQLHPHPLTYTPSLSLNKNTPTDTVTVTTAVTDIDTTTDTNADKNIDTDVTHNHNHRRRPVAYSALDFTSLGHRSRTRFY